MISGSGPAGWHSGVFSAPATGAAAAIVSASSQASR
jgi:hypothetical protein